ncbi:MAG: hypothetical protein AAFQ75_15195 [Pseudomonadota bacterium]
MHQLGLIQIVRVALVFVAVALIATQFFSIVASGGTGQAEAAPPAEFDMPMLDLAAGLPLGVVYFDGADGRGGTTTGALETAPTVRFAALDTQ